MLWVVPLQVDGLQVGLSDSETPGGTGYLGKEREPGGEGREDEENTENKVQA